MKIINQLLLILLFSTSVFAQKNINQYKYVIVPQKFDFVKKPDQYKTSSLTKFLFNKYGFTAFLEDEQFPQDLQNNRCLALVGNVVDASKMLLTKSTIELKDCNGKIIYTSEQGRSKLKDYEKGYHEAIRMAFASVQRLNYKYNSSRGAERLPMPRGENGIPNNVRPKPIDNKVVENRKTVSQNGIPVLNAVQTKNGLVLEGMKKKMVYTVLKTTLPDVFIIKDRNGLLYKNHLGIWMAEFYDNNGQKVSKQYEIDFKGRR